MKREVLVLDDYFNLKKLLHKMTKGLMKEITWWGQHENSYESAQETLREKEGINVSDEYIRTIVTFSTMMEKVEVGDMVFEDDKKNAADIDRINREIPLTRTIDGTLYLMADGSMINTILINDGGTSSASN